MRFRARIGVCAGLVLLCALSSCSTSADPGSAGAPAPSSPRPGSGVGAPYPDASTTGARDPLEKVSETIVVSDDGLMIQNLDITGHIEVNANNVTIRNVRITSTDYWPIIIRGTGTKVENSTIVGVPGSQACIGDGGGSTFTALDLSGAPDGIKIGDKSVLSDSYIHDLGVADGNHNDGVEFAGTTSVTLRHNTILNASAQTSAIFIGGNKTPSTDITVQDNLLAGGGYTVYGPEGRPGVAPSRNVRIIGNRMSTRYFPKGGQYGPVSYWQVGGGNDWTDNSWIDGPFVGSKISP